jgi:hypothetical protein
LNSACVQANFPVSLCETIFHIDTDGILTTMRARSSQGFSDGPVAKSMVLPTPEFHAWV